MNNFWCLVGFEYKKIFSKKSVLITLILAWAIIIFSCFSMVMGSDTESDNNTKNMSAYETMLMDKSYEKEFAGRPLDGTLILEASKAYQKIDKNATNYTESEGYRKYARKYSSIYNLIDAAFAKNGSSFNIDDFQTLSEEDANNYYVFRENQYRLNLTNAPLWSSSDVKKVMGMDKDVKKPFIMEYNGGYQRFFALSESTTVLLLFVISFCIAPVFSNEYTKRTDSLILTSKNGKMPFIFAKMFTSISFCFVLTLLFTLSTYFACMGVYGFDGTNAQIQLLMPAVTYNFTMLDVTILIIITSILGAFLHTGLCLFISSFSKSSIIPMAITTILILVGTCNGINNNFFIKLRHFLPSAMGNFKDIMTQFVFHILGIQFMLYQLACIVALVVGSILLMCTYRNFNRHQIG